MPPGAYVPQPHSSTGTLKVPAQGALSQLAGPGRVSTMGPLRTSLMAGGDIPG